MEGAYNETIRYSYATPFLMNAVGIQRVLCVIFLYIFVLE